MNWIADKTRRPMRLQLFDRGALATYECRRALRANAVRKLAAFLLATLTIICHPCHGEDVDDELRHRDGWTQAVPAEIRNANCEIRNTKLEIRIKSQ